MRNEKFFETYSKKILKEGNYPSYIPNDNRIAVWHTDANSMPSVYHVSNTKEEAEEQFGVRQIKGDVLSGLTEMEYDTVTNYLYKLYDWFTIYKIQYWSEEEIKAEIEWELQQIEEIYQKYNI